MALAGGGVKSPEKDREVSELRDAFGEKIKAQPAVDSRGQPLGTGYVVDDPLLKQAREPKPKRKAAPKPEQTTWIK